MKRYLIGQGSRGNIRIWDRRIYVKYIFSYMFYSLQSTLPRISYNPNKNLKIKRYNYFYSVDEEVLRDTKWGAKITQLVSGMRPENWLFLLYHTGRGMDTTGEHKKTLLWWRGNKEFTQRDCLIWPLFFFFFKKEAWKLIHLCVEIFNSGYWCADKLSWLLSLYSGSAKSGGKCEGEILSMYILNIHWGKMFYHYDLG